MILSADLWLSPGSSLVLHSLDAGSDLPGTPGYMHILCHHSILEPLISY